MLLVRTKHPSLEEILREELRIERLRAIRQFLFPLLVGDGVMVWVVAVWPRILHTWEGRAAVVGWAPLFVSLVFVAGLELAANQRLCRIRRRDAQADAEARAGVASNDRTGGASRRGCRSQPATGLDS